MILSIIAAISKNNVIGKQNKLPWHLPADLKHFKSVTMGKPIIMGRKTFESIGKPLPGRRNIIITHQQDYPAAGCDVFYSIEDALDAINNVPEAMIIGGANLYAQLLPRATRLYITRIDAEIEGDIFFPKIDWSQWQLISEEKFFTDEKNVYSFFFQVWKKG